MRHLLLTRIDKFEAETRRKGHAEGRLEGHRSAAKLLLEAKFGPQWLTMEAQVDAEQSIDILALLIRLLAQERDLPSVRRELWPEQP